MRQKLLFLFLLLQLLAAAVTAQQLPPEAERLKSSIAEARRWLAQVEQERERLLSLHAALRDSVALEASLDSLRQQYAGTAELRQREDSLRLAFSDHQQALRKLEEEARVLREQISSSGQGMPERATQVAREVEQEVGQRAEALLPEAPQPKELLEPPSAEGFGKAAGIRTMRAAEDRFAGHREKLNQARAALDKYKSRYEKVESVKEMPKGLLRANPLKGRPWPERVEAGLLWGLSRQERSLLDLGPYAAWRLTDRLWAGAGFQYRLSVNIEEKPWVLGAEEGLGGFVFADAEVYKGLFGRLHYERLSASPPAAEQAGRLWVNGLSVGVGKRYTIYRQLKGFAVVQYNLLHESGETPYLRPFQARVGVYLNGGSLLRAKK